MHTSSYLFLNLKPTNQNQMNTYQKTLYLEDYLAKLSNSEDFKDLNLLNKIQIIKELNQQ